MTLHKPIIYQPLKSTHEETGVGDFLDPLSIALSIRSTNQLKAVAGDGLYVGAYLAKSVYYVAAAGTDDPAHGDKATPFKTLDYCISVIMAQSFPLTATVYVALKAGETFPISNSYALTGGRLVLTFFGDPQYGDFDSPPVNGSTKPAYMADLQRPIINASIAAGVTGTAGFVMLGPIDSLSLSSAKPSAIELIGVKVNLAGGPHSSGQVDFIGCENGAEGSVSMHGAIVNITDVNAVFGFIGVEANSSVSISQFASQLQVLGNLVAAGAATDQLVARKWFFKFYPDFLGNQQTGLDLFGGTPGSGFMRLSWSDTSSLPVAPSKFNQATYPVLNDPAAGMTNYFFNLTRDQQQRAQNVWSSRPF
jgi:hypothetical protein